MKTNDPLTGGAVTFQNIPESAEMTVLPSENKLDFLKPVERVFGLSIFKVGLPVYKLEKHVISYPSTP